MDRPVLELLRTLLTEEQLLTLAVVVDGEPVAGVLPFLADSGLQSLVVHTSSLARHSRGLTLGARYAAAIVRPLRRDEDPLQPCRLLLEGVVEAPAAEERADLAVRWVDRFASAAMTVDLGDFVFRRLRITGGRLVSGFARAHGLSSRLLAEAAALAR